MPIAAGVAQPKANALTETTLVRPYVRSAHPSRKQGHTSLMALISSKTEPKSNQKIAVPKKRITGAATEASMVARSALLRVSGWLDWSLLID
jgi:hypothetical protein